MGSGGKAECMLYTFLGKIRTVMVYFGVFLVIAVYCLFRLFPEAGDTLSFVLLGGVCFISISFSLSFLVEFWHRFYVSFRS